MKLIEAEKAKDVIHEYFKSLMAKDASGANVYKLAVGIVSCLEHDANLLKAIDELPSAQPEQHTCVNCGRTVNNGGWYADGRTRCPIEEHYALPKDGFCHLWEKRNVTDDDYPERRTDE